MPPGGKPEFSNETHQKAAALSFHRPNAASETQPAVDSTIGKIAIFTAFQQIWKY